METELQFAFFLLLFFKRYLSRDFVSFVLLFEVKVLSGIAQNTL